MAIITKTLNLQTVRAIPNMHAYSAIFIGLIAGTFAPIFVRLAQETGIPSLLPGIARLAFAAIILTPYVLRQHRMELTQLTRRDIVMSAVAGGFLAAHFILLTYALGMVSVMVGTVLVNTIPLWVALLEIFVLKAVLHRLVWVSLAITLIGGAVIGIGGLSETNAQPDDATTAIIETETISRQNDILSGGLLALTSAIMGAAYMIIGRKARRTISVMPYIWLVYGFGGIAGLSIIFLTQTPITGYAPQGYFWLLMLTLVPQLIGHSGFNYALGYLSATIVSISTQTIAISASVVVFFVFREIPSTFDILGSAIIGVGVCIAIVGQTRRRAITSTS